MSNKFFNPYIDVYIPNEKIIEDNFSITNSDGYLTLNDELSLITSQSELNNTFRSNFVETYKGVVRAAIDELSIFEDDPFFVDSLINIGKSDDLIDISSKIDDIRSNAYKSSVYKVFNNQIDSSSDVLSNSSVDNNTDNTREGIKPEHSTHSGGQ